MYCPEKIFTGKNRTGGLLRFVELYNALIRNGFSVDLCCAEEHAVFEEYKVENGITIVGYNGRLSRYLPNEALNLLCNFNTLRELKKKNYDMVISFDVPQTIHLVLLRFTNLYLFLRQDLIEYRKVRYSGSNTFLTSMKLKILGLIEGMCIRRASFILVQCNYDLENLISRHSYIEELVRKKASVQINNANPQWIVDKSSCEKAELPIKREFNFCFVGNFNDSRKGHEELFGAIELLKEYHGRCSFQIVGDGALLDKLRKQYADYDNIYFWGRMSNPISVVKSCNLLIVPSKADSCPNTVMEAIYNGIPVIGSNRGGIPEMLRDKEMLFELKHEEISKYIERFITDESYRNKIISSEESLRKELMFDWGERMVRLLNERGA